MSISGREVVLGVGGGIAAYKACDLLRRMQDHGFLVTVVPTPAALNFVGSATWEALSGRPVHSQVWEDIPSVPHIQLATIADYIVIAPATADLMARIAQGRADDLLTNIVLASGAPKLVVPAMHPEMWLDSATQSNVSLLRDRGFVVLEPDSGRLTGKDSGPGRFPETSRILDALHEISMTKADLLGKKVLVTTGGTREPIDPVRYIGNRSSGKQGFAVAQAALARGAQVCVIAANCADLELPGAEIIPVETTAQLGKALKRKFPEFDILVMCAAVSDAKPVHVSAEKIKKQKLAAIDLELNPDLLAQVSASRKAGQKIIGFAAETENILENAHAKLAAKNLDILYVNDVSGGAIFGSDSTKGSIISTSGTVIHFTEGSKDTLANVLLDQLA